MSDHSDRDSNSDDQSWFEQSENITLMIAALCGVCILLVVVEFFYTNPHPHFDLEESFAFHAWFGFVAFVVIVMLGRVLRIFVKRPEDYYDQ